MPRIWNWACIALADPNIKSKCESPEWRMALIHLLCDYAIDRSVVHQAHCKDEDEDGSSNLYTLVQESFLITRNDFDRVPNSLLQEWCTEHGFTLAKKLKPLLLEWGCTPYRSKSARGLCGLSLIPKEEPDDEEKKAN